MVLVEMYSSCRGVLGDDERFLTYGWCEQMVLVNYRILEEIETFEREDD